MSKSVTRVTEALRAAGLPAPVREMAEGTRTAAEAAAALGCEIDQIAKSVILRGTESDTLFLFVTAGGNRVDVGAATALAGQTLAPADAAFVRSRTGFAIGGVAPLGHLEKPRAFFDTRLLQFPIVWAAAGTPRHVFSAEPHALASVIGAEIAAVSSDQGSM